MRDLLALSLLEWPIVANRKSAIIPRTAKNGQAQEVSLCQDLFYVIVLLLWETINQ